MSYSIKKDCPKLFNCFPNHIVATKYPRANSKGTKGNPGSDEPLNASKLNLKVDGIDSKQECLEKYLLEYMCGTNIVSFLARYFFYLCLNSKD